MKLFSVIMPNRTMKLISKYHLSIARLGDGEMRIINNKSIGFQDADAKLAKRLCQILSQGSTSRCLVGIPDSFQTYRGLTKESRKFWKEYNRYHFTEWKRILNPKNKYVSANITRCYMRYRHKSGKFFKKFQQLWNNKRVFIIEGKDTHFGEKNDLLKGAKSVERIQCPSHNAFSCYARILQQAKKRIPIANDVIILIALGPCATVLAYDLSSEYQAIDIGHLDIEYEWFIRQATSKIKINGKFVNEVS